MIADTHIGHKNILKYEPSRVQIALKNDYNDADQYIIDNWNSVISNNDTILHLGDLAFNHKDLISLSKKLNGNKILLLGNHDKSSNIKILIDNGWKIIDRIVLEVNDERVQNIQTMLENKYIFEAKMKKLFCCYVCDIEDTRIMFSHFPLFDDNKYDEKYKPITNVLEEIFIELDCNINIHGHIHSKVAKEDCCINVSVENTQFQPIKIQALLEEKGLQ